MKNVRSMKKLLLVSFVHSCFLTGFFSFLLLCFLCLQHPLVPLPIEQLSSSLMLLDVFFMMFFLQLYYCRYEKDLRIRPIKSASKENHCPVGAIGCRKT